MAHPFRIVFPLLLPLAAAAQDATFRTGTELVQISVVAQDRNGNPVADLRREEFQLFDNGAPQEIRLFLANRTANSSSSAVAPAANGIFTNRIAAPEGGRSGYSVILFDNLNTGFEYTARARLNALAALHAIPAGDRIALYALWCQFQVIREFTPDRDLLLRQLEAFKPAAGAVCAASVPVEDPLPVSPGKSTADLIDPGAASARARAAEDSARIAALQAGTVTDQEMIAIADHLAGIPGRKNLIWIAQTFPLSPKALQRLINAGVAIYPVDAIGSTIAVQSEKEEHAAPIRALAAMTGGKATVDRDDMDVAVGDALNDGRISYTLGFYKPAGNAQRDAGVHRIEVRSRRAGVSLRYRTSYSVETPVKRPNPREPEAVAAVLEALNRPVEATVIPITVVAARTRNKLSLALTVDVAALDLTLKNGVWQGQAELVTRFMSNDGKMAGQISALTVSLRLKPATYAAALEQGFALKRELDIPRKAADLDLLIGNLSTGKIGTLTVPLSQIAAAPQK